MKHTLTTPDRVVIAMLAQSKAPARPRVISLIDRMSGAVQMVE